MTAIMEKLSKPPHHGLSCIRRSSHNVSVTRNRGASCHHCRVGSISACHHSSLVLFRRITPTTISCFARPSCVERRRSLANCTEYVVGIILWVFCHSLSLSAVPQEVLSPLCPCRSGDGAIAATESCAVAAATICYSCRGLCTCAACRQRALRSASPVERALRSASPVEPCALRSASPVEPSVSSPSKKRRAPAVESSDQHLQPPSRHRPTSTLPYTIVEMPRALR